MVVALPFAIAKKIADCGLGKKKREKARTDQTGTFSEETLSFLELLFRQKFS